MSGTSSSAPDGIRQLQTLRGHGDVVLRLSFSPSGDQLASTSVDKSIRIWDWKKGKELAKLDGHHEGVNEVAWHPGQPQLFSCSFDRSIRVWNVVTGAMEKTIHAHADDVSSISLSPSGDLLASASSDRTIRIWRTSDWEQTQILQAHTDGVYRVAWSPCGTRLASCARDGRVIVWDTESWVPIWKVGARAQRARWGSVVWSRKRGMLCATSFDGSVRVWPGALRSPEGAFTFADHAGVVRSLAFSPDEDVLVTSSMDDSVRVWRTKDWQMIGEIAEPTSRYWPQTIAFHPTKSVLATFGEEDRVVRVWELATQPLVGRGVAERDQVYRNAKVVLLGETGVGKSGLRLVLLGEKFVPTESTYGRRVWSLGVEECAGHEGRELRETLLWDFAGQPGYQTVQQLYLHEVAVALLVFDARHGAGDPLTTVRYWHRALLQAQQRQQGERVPLKILLVFARSDAEGSPLSQTRIQEVLREWQLQGYFETSAKTGKGIPELSTAIRESIAWEALPKVISPDIFRDIHEFVTAERTDDVSGLRRDRVLLRAEELFHGFIATNRQSVTASDPKMRDAFDVCISRLENRDVVRRLSFGGLVLLRPEYLDAYASAIVMAAEAADGAAAGSLLEDDVLKGRVAVPDAHRLPDSGLHQFLLTATVEELTKHQLALREVSQDGIYLVFPAQFKRDRPDPGEVKWHTASIGFEGPILNLYAALVVRLAHSGLFATKREDMWKNGAIFSADSGGKCGLSLRVLGDGSGELRVFYGVDWGGRVPSVETRFRFESFVLKHLEQRAIGGSVKRKYRAVCPNCGETYPESWAQADIERGQSHVVCPRDKGVIELLDPFERMGFGREILEMNRRADDERDARVGRVVVEGKKEADQYDVFMSYRRVDQDAVRPVYEKLLDRGIRPWMDVYKLRGGDVWLREVARLIATGVKTAAIFVGGSDSGGSQAVEIDQLFHAYVARGVRIIPVLLAGVTDLPEWCSYLSSFHLVKLGRPNPDPYDELVYAITGKR